jgi:hypothetical protein
MVEQITNPELITGADNIAQFLGLSKRKQIYNILEKKRRGKSDIPIWHEPGLGLVANRELLLLYMARKSGLIAPVQVAATKTEL